MGRTVVITGASAGIGAQAALQFARQGDDVVLLGRSPTKLAAVVDRIAEATGRTPAQYACDFADLSDVRATAGRIAATYPVVDVLANNAGLIAPGRSTTVDGHDLTIQVNHLKMQHLGGVPPREKQEIMHKALHARRAGVSLVYCLSSEVGMKVLPL